MEEVGLSADDLKKKPHAFSGGQRQRIGIARALAADPELLICDESVSALDVSVQAQVLNLLNGIKKNRGLSMIFISHDPDVVRYMCDRIMHLQPLEA
jgi:ABC-type oligopeptide transport system ATPase subunit